MFFRPHNSWHPSLDVLCEVYLVPVVYLNLKTSKTFYEAMSHYRILLYMYAAKIVSDTPKNGRIGESAVEATTDESDDLPAPDID